MAREQKMYGVVLRHLSGIQKGIQFGHAVVEYSLKFGDTLEYKRWSKRDKTMMLLQGYTDGQLEEAYEELKKLGIPVALFKEPDMGNVTTAIAFLLDETVWNTQKYPDGDTPVDLALRRIKNRFDLATN